MLKLDYPYFDNNATTPVHPEVLKVLNEYQTYYYANPSSTVHPLGMICNTLYVQHRKTIADILQVKDNELIITSGATEAINTAIKGIFFQYGSQKNHIISCETEHSAVLNTLKYLEEYHHAQITLLKVNENGEIDLDVLEKNINDQTLMICLMAANNETGVLHPVEEIYQIAQKKKVLFFSDTTQMFGKTKWRNNIPADIFCGSAHKFHGPKGIGFLVIRNAGRKIFLPPLLHGGQQQELRSGTIPLPLIAAMSKALEIVYSERNNIHYIQSLRDDFEQTLKQKFSVKIHGENTMRIFNTSNVIFSENDYEKVLKAMKKFCFSKASACSDGSGKPSHVLSAMGLSRDEIKRSFRFSFSRLNNKREVDSFVEFCIS